MGAWLPAICISAVMLLAGCAPAPPPVQAPKAEVTLEPWYGETTGELAAMVREGNALFDGGRFEDASALVTKAQPAQARLLAASHPTLAAMEAVSGLDDLYGRLLLRNRQYGWARSFFQNNAIRWKTWKPQTPETLERSKKAAAAVAECDRRLAE